MESITCTRKFTGDTCSKSSEGDSDKDIERLRVETSSEGGLNGSSSTEHVQSSETENKSSDENGTPSSNGAQDIGYSASVSAYSDTNSFGDSAQSEETDSNNEEGVAGKVEKDCNDKDFSSKEIDDGPTLKRRKISNTTSKSNSRDKMQTEIDINNHNGGNNDDDDNSYSFREQISSLREEDGHLMLISSTQNDKYPFADRILGDCGVKLPETVASAVQMLISRIEKAEIATMALKTVPFSKKGFCLTNASTANNIIVYVSRSFLEMTGYSASDILGKPLSFMNGPETDPVHQETVHAAFIAGSEVKVQMKNYHSSGRTFLNDFQMSPLKDSTGQALLFLVIQVELPVAVQPAPPRSSSSLLSSSLLGSTGGVLTSIPSDVLVQPLSIE